METYEGKSLYDVMLDHPNRLASRSYIELAYSELEGEIRKAEQKVGYTLGEERRRLEQGKSTWKYMTRANIYNSVQAGIGSLKMKYNYLN